MSNNTLNTKQAAVALTVAVLSLCANVGYAANFDRTKIDAKVIQSNVGDVTGRIDNGEAQITDSETTALVESNAVVIETGSNLQGDVWVGQTNVGNVDGSIDYGSASFQNAKARAAVGGNYFGIHSPASMR